MDILILIEIARMLVILLVSLVVSFTFKRIIIGTFHKITSKTKTDIDDIILKNISKPLFLFFFLLSFSSVFKYMYPHLYIDILEKIVFIITALLVTHIVSNVFLIGINKWFKVQKRYEKTPQLIGKIVSITLYIIAFMIILRHFNIEITPLLATLGIGGLAVGLALQNTLSNFFSGVHIITDKPVKVGDYIEIENEIRGYVEDIGWRSIRIRTLGNNIVIIPNSKLAESIIKNYHMPIKELSVRVAVGVSYDSDLEKVERITINVAKNVMKKLGIKFKNFEPFIRYREFGDSSINFVVIMRARNFVEQYLLVHEFIKELHKKYKKEGIVIPFPQRDIHIIRE